MPHVEEDSPADELCKSEFYLDYYLKILRKKHENHAKFLIENKIVWRKA